MKLAHGYAYHRKHMHIFQAGLSGASLYVKTGHLASAIAEYN